MRTLILAFAMMASTASLAHANALSDKVQMDHPGVTGAGRTANPLARTDTGGVSDRAMRLSPGVNGSGSAINPAARPDDAGSLSEKASRDLLRRVS